LILLKYLFKLKDLISRALKKLNGLLGIKTFPKFSTSIGFFLQRSKKNRSPQAGIHPLLLCIHGKLKNASFPIIYPYSYIKTSMAIRKRFMAMENTY